MKLVGSTAWAVTEGEVLKGIARGSRTLRLDVTCDGVLYDVSMEKNVGASQYSGRWKCRADGSTGNADCTLYRSKGEVLLFGNWLEANEYCRWWAILHKVKHFAGEVDTQDRNGNTAGSRSRVKALLGAKCREEKNGTSPIPSKKRVRR